jgi:hypothetical protein
MGHGVKVYNPLLKIENQGVSSKSAICYHPIMYTPPRGKCVDVDTREGVTSSEVNNVNTCEVRRNTANNVNGSYYPLA